MECGYHPVSQRYRHLLHFLKIWVTFSGKIWREKKIPFIPSKCYSWFSFKQFFKLPYFQTSLPDICTQAFHACPFCQIYKGKARNLHSLKSLSINPSNFENFDFHLTSIFRFHPYKEEVLSEPLIHCTPDDSVKLLQLKRQRQWQGIATRTETQPNVTFSGVVIKITVLERNGTFYTMLFLVLKSLKCLSKLHNMKLFCTVSSISKQLSNSLI